MRVMVLGTFDILHIGHFQLLEFCKQMAGDDEVVVGLNTDKFVHKFKGHLPVMNFKERQLALKNLSMVSKVVKNPQPTLPATAVMRDEKIDLIVSGMDWLVKDLVSQWGTTLKELTRSNIKVCFFPFRYDISSSKIKERIRLQS